MRKSIFLLVYSLSLLFAFSNAANATLIVKYDMDNDALTDEISRLSIIDQAFYFPKTIENSPFKAIGNASLMGSHLEKSDHIISMLLMDENKSVHKLSADDIMPVPEPATMVLMGLGLFLIAGMGKKVLNRS